MKRNLVKPGNGSGLVDQTTGEVHSPYSQKTQSNSKPRADKNLETLVSNLPPTRQKFAKFVLSSYVSDYEKRNVSKAGFVSFFLSAYDEYVSENLEKYIMSNEIKNHDIYSIVALVLMVHAEDNKDYHSFHPFFKKFYDLLYHKYQKSYEFDGMS